MPSCKPATGATKKLTDRTNNTPRQAKHETDGEIGTHQHSDPEPEKKREIRHRCTGSNQPTLGPISEAGTEQTHRSRRA